MMRYFFYKSDAGKIFALTRLDTATDPIIADRWDLTVKDWVECYSTINAISGYASDADSYYLISEKKANDYIKSNSWSKTRLANKKLILELKKYELNKSKITETQRIKYSIKHPAFKDIDFTEHSKQHLTWPKAVEFAASQGNGAILQSAREASAFKIAAIGKSNVDMLQATRTQVTRTVALYFKVGNKFYAAIDDTVNPEQNIVIAHAQPGFKSNSETGKYLLPITDALVKGALLRAEKSGRIVEINTTNVLRLATKAVNGKSEFGQNDWTKAVLLDVAESYAQMLNQCGYSICLVWSLTPENLKDRGVDGKHVEVRPVGLGYGFGNIAAGLYYGSGGRACGVRHVREFSIRNKSNAVKLVKKVFAFNDKDKL